jgi:hypothetical protein
MIVAKGILRIQHDNGSGCMFTRVSGAKLPPGDYLIRLLLPEEKGNWFGVLGDLHSIKECVVGTPNDLLCSDWQPTEKSELKLLTRWGDWFVHPVSLKKE